MPAEELENELRHVFARAAADLQDPQQAGERLLQHRYRPGGGRRRLAAGGVAALVLVGGASYGVSAALASHRPATTGTAVTALTSVRGCTTLRQADGTLLRVKRHSVVIKTASGHRVTVATTASTKVSMLGLPLSYITGGLHIMVTGHQSHGTIAAAYVTIGRPIRHGKIQSPPGVVAVHGTVSQPSGAGFTLVTASGTQIPVTTSSRTQVVNPPPAATLSQLRIGISTIAVGKVGRHGTLTANGVLQQPGGHRTIQVGNCSPSSIDAAITTAFVTRH